MPGDEPRQKVCVDTSRQIVSGGNRAKRARVVVETCGIVDPGSLRDLLAVPRHAVDRIVEPPRRTESHGWIMTSEWRELARVRRLVERKQEQREPRIVSIRLEQRTEIARVFGLKRNVGALVGPEALEDGRVVIAQRAGVQLHDETIVR